MISAKSIRGTGDHQTAAPADVGMHDICVGESEQAALPVHLVGDPVVEPVPVDVANVAWCVQRDRVAEAVGMGPRAFLAGDQHVVVLG